jgi:hypothetical protein
MVKGYDNIALNEQIALDLTFQEGVGLRAHDRAGAISRACTLVGPPVWTQLALSNLTFLEFDGAGDYLECAGANTLDLDFTDSDYTLAMWIRPATVGATAMLMGRYELDKTGWELYHTDNPPNNYVELRHHHQSLGADTRDGCYSAVWPYNEWALLGITRHAAAGTSYPQHYKNGVPVTTTWDAGGLKDPDSSARDLVIGVRFSKNLNWYEGGMWRPRIWARELSAFEMAMLFEMERAFFGV